MIDAFVFPGQGSQVVGMAQQLAADAPEAKAVLAEVDDTLGYSLSKIMAEGPDEELRLTANAQPALMASSIAVLKVLETRSGQKLDQFTGLVAGHSLGEYTALCAAGYLSLADTARLLRLRGEAMQQATPVGLGAMAAILGATIEQAEEIAKLAQASSKLDDGSFAICVVANDNATGQIVLSGHKAAVDRAIEIAKEKGIKRAILLPVSAPFHCPLMQPAAEVMAEALAQADIQQGSVQYYANTTADIVENISSIAKHLTDQVCAKVRWREIILAMELNGVERTVELGTGKVLSGLTRRIASDMASLSLESLSDIDAFIENTN